MSAMSLKSVAQVFFRRRRSRILPDFWHASRNLRSYFQKKIPQIKARPFEITGSGGFCITGAADDTESYFIPGKEIAIYKDTNDLIEKIRYYLKHDDERKAVAKAGYERALREHNYNSRLVSVFEQLGLKN